MAGVADLVDGDGFISDESSFYGDDEVKQSLERQSKKRKLALPYYPFAKAVKLDSTTITGKNDNVVDFLKSRPQIAAMEKSTKRSTAELRTGRSTTDVEAEDLLNDDGYQSDPAVRQQHETIDQFLKRNPVAEPATAAVGPWLWVRSELSLSRKNPAAKQDINAFIEASVSLLDGFLKQKSRIEADNPGKAQATITRHMGPYKDQLEDDLLRTAVENGTTCGKWMLFPTTADLPRYWRVVAEATAQGRLGPVSKVGTHDPFDTKGVTLICVYTYDFTDLADVRRVLDELLELSLCTRDGRPIYYKCDAYTYLGISSENAYRLRASLFSSKEVFGNEAKVLQDGPVARLKKRNKTIDSFFAT